MRPASALRTLLALAAFRLLLHTLTNGQYGFHRDELATLDDARHLAGDTSLTLLLRRWWRASPWSCSVPRRPPCDSLRHLAQCIAMVLAGLMARELGGGRRAQIVTALAVAVSPVSMSAGHLFQYVSFDFLWAVVTVYFVIRLLNSGNPRWWLAIGAAIGLGLMTRYTIAWLVAGLAVGFLLTPARKLLMSRWLLAGAAVTLVIVLPNLIWQASHGFISLDFLRTIHARDIRIGRTDGFLWKQLVVPAHPFTIPLWIAGLLFYFRKPEGERYRAWGGHSWPRLVFFATGPGPGILHGSAVSDVAGCRRSLSDKWPRWARGLNWAGLAAALGLGIALVLPAAPIEFALV